MEATLETPQFATDSKRWTTWLSYALSAVPILMMLLSASFKLSHPPQVMDMFVTQLGYPAGILLGLAVLEISVVVLYAVPRTAVLGAILMTGYLGGAIATHLRVGQTSSIVAPLALGVLAWAGLYLRDDRLHALLPLRTKEKSSKPAHG
jgi:hypothetical protein